jgi:hypothetical protein
MKQLLFFLFAACFATVHGQSCTRITFKIAANNTDEGFSETTVCGDKSVTVFKNGLSSTKCVVNTASKSSIILADNGFGNKVASVLPIMPGEVEKKQSKIKDEDFHFTGELKMIAGYNCEKFTIENEKGKATGYLTPELKLENPSDILMLQTSWGTILELTATTKVGTGTILATKVETIIIENENDFFSTEIPDGYTNSEMMIRKEVRE